MKIIQQPESLSLSGNVKDFILSEVTGSVEFVLTCDAVEILRENYEPIAGRVEIPVKLVIDELLKISIPDFDSVIYEQTRAVKTFSARIDTQIITFTVVKGGFSALESTPVFFKTNFLTWQPQQKFIISNQPEFLSYYTQETGNLKIKGYFSDKAFEIHTIILESAKLYAFNLNWDIVNGYFSKQVLYYDVWVENPDGNRLSYIQRYVLSPFHDNQQIYLFENTIGGIDTVLFSGLFSSSLKTEGNLSTIKDETTDSDIDMSCVYMQNTGFLPSKDYAEWLRDFFVSPQRFHVTDSARRIFIEESENKFETDNLNTYEFEFRYAKETKYNNIVRNRESLPELLEFPVVDELFFLAPRLTEFPLAAIADDLILPVQYAFENAWRRISVDAITRYVLGYTIDNIETIIDLTNYWQKTELVREDLYLKFLDRKIFAGYADETENAEKWADHFFEDYINQPLRTTDDVLFNSISVKEYCSSENYASGLLGTGYMFDSRGYGEVTRLDVREYLYVPEIIKNKVSVVADEFWFTGGGVVDTIECTGMDRYKISLKQEKEVPEIPWKEGDILRGIFSLETGFSTVYYTVEKIEDKHVFIHAENAPEFFSYLTDSLSNYLLTEDGAYLMVNTGGYPDRFLTLARQGNVSDPDRQGSIYVDSINKYIRVLDGVSTTTINFENIRVQLGDLSGLVSPVLGKLNGFGLYSSNVYLIGDFMLRNGKSVATEFNNVSETLVSISTRLTDTEAAIENTVSKTVYDAYTQSTSTLLSQITQRITDVEASIESTVSKTVFDAYKQSTSTLLSQITQRVTDVEASIESTVSKTVFDAYTQSTSTLLSQITQKVNNNTAELELTVKADNVIASINASVEKDGTSALRLKGDKIELNGNTVMKNKSGSVIDFLGSDNDVININDGFFRIDKNGMIYTSGGFFYGSVSELFKKIETENPVENLDFSTGFNFSGQAAYNAYKTYVLPDDVKYQGVRASVFNTGDSRMSGYIYIKIKNDNNFIFPSGGYDKTVKTVKLNFTRLLELKAVLGNNNTLKWYILNHSDFTYDSQDNSVYSKDF
ncbi:hypothetical protein [Sanguibacteroides justesenii]|uniref:Uncharacterized protein n=1 Tax=Sanguibacteroides justesenii TaxID=1547597 RepID=A0AB34R958_9PORP|nr:hypothetical protein [Sanguibacteroides justesenii]KIO45471.1 hypothetical protein IE90_08690 [Sanguibacteroides justesenii]